MRALGPRIPKPHPGALPHICTTGQRSPFSWAAQTATCTSSKEHQGSSSSPDCLEPRQRVGSHLHFVWFFGPRHLESKDAVDVELWCPIALCIAHLASFVHDLLLRCSQQPHLLQHRISEGLTGNFAVIHAAMYALYTNTMRLPRKSALETSAGLVVQVEHDAANVGLRLVQAKTHTRRSLLKGCHEFPSSISLRETRALCGHLAKFTFSQTRSSTFCFFCAWAQRTSGSISREAGPRRPGRKPSAQFASWGPCTVLVEGHQLGLSRSHAAPTGLGHLVLQRSMKGTSRAIAERCRARMMPGSPALRTSSEQDHETTGGG